MARIAENALGYVPTPFGPVRFRLESISGSEQRGFACRGATLGLRWLFPTHKVGMTSTRIVLNPAKDSPTPVDMVDLFGELKLIWKERVRLDPTGQNTLAPKPLAEVETPAGSAITIKDIIAILNKESQATVRASTYATYVMERKMLLRFMPASTPAAIITKDMVLDFIIALKSARLAPETSKKLFVQLKRILTRATRDRHIDQNPADGIKAPKVPRLQPRFLTVAERQRLMARAGEFSDDLYLVIVLGCYLGLRKAEILAVTWKDIDLTAKVAQVANSEFFTTKNGRSRSVPISDELVAILLRYRLHI